MSRSPAEIYFEDGAVLHGLFHDTVEQMHPNLYKDISTFNKAFEDFEWLEWKECFCDGEVCLVAAGYHPYHVFKGEACREHLCFQEPFDLRELPCIAETIAYWNDPSPECSESRKKGLITLPAAFQPVVAEIYTRMMAQEITDELLEQIVIWE